LRGVFPSVTNGAQLFSSAANGQLASDQGVTMPTVVNVRTCQAVNVQVAKAWICPSAAIAPPICNRARAFAANQQRQTADACLSLHCDRPTALQKRRPFVARKSAVGYGNLMAKRIRREQARSRTVSAIQGGSAARRTSSTMSLRLSLLPTAILCDDKKSIAQE